jgi:adenylate cyclase
MTEPAPLTLNLLGEMEVIRDGKPLVLPPSRKARALLAYLVVTRRPHRRDRLCSIFWDVPDDPRGALRSSLSMLRRMVDTPHRQRVLAEHDAVRFDGTDAKVDLFEVQGALARGMDAASTEVLEQAVVSYRGELVEDLELSNCPDFQTWCGAEREEARRLRSLILRTLIERHVGAPEAALPHARTLVHVDADNVSAHATLLRLLVATGRQREAQAQRDFSSRLLGEVSADAAQELARLWSSPAREPVPAEDARGVPSTELVSPSEGTSEVDSSLAEPAEIRHGPEGWTAEPAPGSRVLNSGRRHIAVLPFTNMSDDTEQDYFADGITEDIITDLSQVSALFVVPRNTAFTYKGKSMEIVKIARRLNVGHILQGSVRKAFNQIRINVQLIDGATGDHLWAERFDRQFEDIFALQDDISKNVVAALKLKLLPEELTAITKRPTLNAQAYSYYLEARLKLSVSWSNKEYLRSARKLFTKAVKADPGYARAYAGIADCDAFLWVNGDLDVSYGHMLANSSKALELAPNLAEAHASRGVALYVAGRPRDAIEAFKQAISLDSELFEAQFFYGLSCRDIGDFQCAAVCYERAAELQDRNHRPLAMLADAYWALGRREQCISAARGCLSRIENAFGLNPEVADVLATGAAALVYLGENARAEKWAQRAVLLDPESDTVRYNAACTNAVIGKLDLAQECLEFAFSQAPRARSWLLAIAKHDRQLDSLRGRPDFQNLMKRLEADVAAS